MAPHLLQSLINKLKQLPGSDVAFLGTEPHIRITHIYNFENRLKIKLPVEYKQFLLRYNGGYPILVNFDYLIGNEKECSTISYFLSISTRENVSLFHFIQNYQNLFSNNLIPIAIDIYNNLILLQFLNNEVYYWNCENDNIGLIATTFNKFLKSLY